MAKAPSIDDFLAALRHARKDEVFALRAAILASHPSITETVKWNAPNYRWAGEDRVTMRLNPGDRLDLIFHRGARKTDAAAARFSDEDGLITWLAPDRGMVSLPPGPAMPSRFAALAALALAWMQANA